MIEKSFLPNLCLLSREIGCLGQRLFQLADPAAQNEIRTATDEQMDMVGHDHVTANGHIELAFGSTGKENEGRMDIIAS